MSGMDKKRILMVSANPTDGARLRLDEEERTIREVLRDSKNRNEFDIQPLPAARDADLQRELAEYEPHVIHFCGHGVKEGLGFDAGNDQTHWIDIHTLVDLFRSARSHLECVIFNACYTEALAEVTSEHIDFVVGMNDSVGDKAAIHFSRGFYTGLFAGKFYPAAFDDGLWAVKAQGFPDHLFPQLKIRDNAARVSFLPDCNPDILILCPEANREWARGVVAELDDLLSQRLGSRNTFTLKLATEAEENLAGMVEMAGLLLPVLSRQCAESEACGQALSAFLEVAGAGGIDRVFPVQIEATLLPEALQAVLPHPFWKTGGEILEPGGAGFNDRMNTLVSEISARLYRLRDEIEHRRKMAAQHEEFTAQENVELPEAFLFLNAAPEDRKLLDEIIGFLQENDAEFAEPIPISANPTPEEIRRDLELNLESCDLYVVVYGKSRISWVREQVLYSRRVWRKRREDMKIVVVHAETRNGAKEDIRVSAKNLRIFNCPPDRCSEYLPQVMREAVNG